MKEKTVLVSGCFDLIHGGHIAFFKEASSFGKLIVCLGSDKNIKMLKHHETLFNQDERLYVVKNINGVHDAVIASGSGMLHSDQVTTTVSMLWLSSGTLSAERGTNVIFVVDAAAARSAMASNSVDGSMPITSSTTSL